MAFERIGKIYVMDVAFITFNDPGKPLPVWRKSKVYRQLTCKGSNFVPILGVPHDKTISAATAGHDTGERLTALRDHQGLTGASHVLEQGEAMRFELGDGDGLHLTR